MKNMPILLNQCQTAYSAVAIASCFELLVTPDADSWLAPDCQHLWAWALLQWSVGVCSMNRHATLDWSGRGSCDRARAMGQLKASVLQNYLVTLFWLSPSTISKLKAKFRVTGDVRDKLRSPRKMTPQEDCFLTLSVLRNRRFAIKVCRTSPFSGNPEQTSHNQSLVS